MFHGVELCWLIGLKPGLAFHEAALHQLVQSRQLGVMPNKDRPLVDRHAPKNGVGWLVNAQQGKVSQFRNDNPTAHAQWVVVETRQLRGGGQPIARKMLSPTHTTYYCLAKQAFSSHVES